MAYTVTVLAKTIHGNERVHHLQLTADAAEGNVSTGFAIITNFSLSVGSMTTSTAIPTAYPNKNSSGTASLGTLGISGATSGDEYYCVVFGR